MIADAGHTTYDLDPVPIWASPADLAVYQHRITVNYQLGEGEALLALTNHYWAISLQKLSTNIPRLHQESKILDFGWNNTILTLILIDSNA